MTNNDYRIPKWIKQPNLNKTKMFLPLDSKKVSWTLVIRGTSLLKCDGETERIKESISLKNFTQSPNHHIRATCTNNPYTNPSLPSIFRSVPPLKTTARSLRDQNVKILTLGRVGASKPWWEILPTWAHCSVMEKRQVRKLFSME